LMNSKRIVIEKPLIRNVTTRAQAH
jgi:hypothetical protein